MADNTEVEDRVDLDDDNYSEDDEEVMEDEGAGDVGEEEPQEDTGSEDGGKEKHAELLDLPPHGSEVFIGGLSRDISEEDLRELCEPLGEIFEVLHHYADKVLKNRDTGESKGFAFVLVLKIIELIKDPQNPGRNRGFAFVEFYNNACADYSRQKMSSASFKLDGNTPTVTWADPKITPDHSAATSQVKALYVKNIPENTSTERIKGNLPATWGSHQSCYATAKAGGKRDFGFIHYAERSSALKLSKRQKNIERNGLVNSLG
ncbi:hypothetical protein SASPL_145920 [Salvia splendens]|uniref:RRM domain-containing protein n=1 Tax=Salvia splendens TaxID=180675 RepID=A0A8X8Z8G9_SALSN|nr:hypothetical protein SASPL_145920 [Salvia splendens]